MNIFDQLPCAVTITDKNGLLLRVNDALCQLFGINPDDSCSFTLEHLVTRASYVLLQSHVWPTVLRDRKIDEFYIKLKTLSGEILPAFINVSTVNIGEERQYCWIFFIAKERAEFEEKLVNIGEQLKVANSDLDTTNQSLNQANKELEQFAYIASHDLKEPMRTMSAFSCLLVDKIKKGDTEKVQYYIDFIQSASSRMHTLINDLLEYSRAGNSKLKKTQVSIQELIDDVKNRLLVQIEETEATIEVNFKVNHIYGDYLCLSLVLQNLLQNSMKFRKENTPVNILISSKYMDENNLCIEICDNGIGIAEQYQSKIFAAFEKIHSREKYSGSGIGLATVSKIMSRHEGSIKIKSKPDEGTCFMLILPNK